MEYELFFEEGERELIDHDYTSHNTERLDVEGVKTLLLTLPAIRRELAAAGRPVESTA
nr:hypothetical protein [Nocardioides lijunqiniae]